MLAAERDHRRPTVERQIEVTFTILKLSFGLNRTLAKTSLGPITRFEAKVTAHTYGLYVNRLPVPPMGGHQGFAGLGDLRNRYLARHKCRHGSLAYRR